MRLPSGDTTGLLSGPRRRVSWRTSPVATSTAYTSLSRHWYSASGSRSPLNTRLRPSGVHRGAPWSKSPRVTWRGVPPVAGTTKTCRNPSSTKPRRSRRYTSRSTTRGAGVQRAESGRPGSRGDQLCPSGTTMVKAMERPSGDQAMLSGADSRRVTWVAAPSASM